MNTVPFSVLLSLYHAEKPEYLRACLHSLAIQTLPVAETVVVFDGMISPELADTVNAFQAALNIKIVRLPENVGLGLALQEGIKHCTHEWICRMDTDDIAVPQRFAVQAAYWQRNPDIAVLGGQIAEFDTLPENAQNSRCVPHTHHDIALYARKRNPINHMTVAFKKSAVLAAGNYRHAPLYEDYDLWVRMLQNGCQFANLPETLVYARAGDAMYQRRGGWAYACREIKMQWWFYRSGFLTAWQMGQNLALRLPVRLLPQSLRAWVYRHLLRQKQVG
ncbi:MAG: glycosyltransferase [Alysiella sp.]|uniref:glycosyltransferase n=1 Tax=Alysiella sp. TaxID=1872483 RepID=UPI0026DDA67D|nr:glycosyltransferase [Alysiella sp.]MDO4433503.1 glycosyltransferase [Alysiella sp.]